MDSQKPPLNEVGSKLLTKEGWKELGPKAQWDVQVALRGPDCNNSETIKWFSTAVIRGHVRNVMRTGGTNNTDLHLVIIPEGWQYLPLYNSEDKELKKTLRAQHPLLFWNASHFLQHVIEAAQWLSIPMGWVESEVWIKGSMLHATEMGKLLILSMKKLDINSKENIEELERHMKTFERKPYHSGEWG